MHFLTIVDIARIFLIMTLLYLAYIDLRTFRLPNFMTIPMLCSGLIFNYFGLGFVSLKDAIAGAIIGYIFLWAPNQIYLWIKKQNGIGMGDAKLLAALGAWLGVSPLPGILFLASISGLLGGLLWLRFQKQAMRAAFPFGPFLAIAGIIELLWPQHLQYWFLSNPI